MSHRHKMHNAVPKYDRVWHFLFCAMSASSRARLYGVGDNISLDTLPLFFLSEPVAFRRVYGLESYSRTSWESNHHQQSVSDTRVPRYQLHHEDDSPRHPSAETGDFKAGWKRSHSFPDFKLCWISNSLWQTLFKKSVGRYHHKSMATSMWSYGDPPILARDESRRWSSAGRSVWGTSSLAMATQPSWRLGLKSADFLETRWGPPLFEALVANS